jgi:hypothetical protein
MKKIFLLIILLFPLSVFSYNPTTEDRELVNNTILNLEKSTKNKSELWFNKNLNSFNFFIESYEKNDRVKFILSEVRDFLAQKQNILSEKRTLELEKKIENNEIKKRKSFFDEH